MALSFTPTIESISLEEIEKDILSVSEEDRRGQDLPFNISLMDNSKRILSTLRQVRVVDTMDGMTNNFHEEGLFSIPTFGRPGEPDRMKRFGYIDMKTFVLHPLIYKEIIRLKSLYRGILSGKTYAKWNDELKDFERSNEVEGDTGYSFFLSKWNDIVFAENKSDKRQLRIDLINKYRKESLVRYLLVIPAGLRELQVDEQGRATEDEINGMYRRAIGVSNTLTHTVEYSNDPTQDTARWSLQLAFLEIYETLRSMIEGKKGFIQAKWARRRIFNGTRNVISSMDLSAPSPDSVQMPDVNDTVVGLYQAMKGALPVAVHAIKSSEIGRAFDVSGNAVELIDPDTLELTWVNVSHKNKDRWATVEGLEKMVQNYKDAKIRHKPITVEGHYVGLIYDDGDVFKVFRDISTLPEDRDPKYVRPITWAEFLYTINYARFKELYGTITRYPITGIGSIYPTKLYVKTTVVGRIRKPLNDFWEEDPSLPVANEMPTPDDTHVDSLVPNSTRLAGLGAD